MSNGLKLGVVVSNILGRKQLTLSQQADIDSSSGGNFIPTDMGEALAMVLKLDHTNNASELIKLYKRLPQPIKLSNELADYLNLPHSAELSKTVIGQGILTKEFCMSNMFNIVNKEHNKVLGK